MELLKKKKDKKPKANGIELNVDTTGMSEEEIAAMEAAKVLEQYDRESAFRNGLPKGISLVISAILIAFALFQIYTSIWTIPAQVLRSVHLAFALTLVFLLYPAGKHMAKNKVQWYDYVLAILAVAVVLYIPLNYEYIIKNVGNYSSMDIVVGAVGILLLMEGCRRVVGMPILIVVLAFLLYAKFGNLIPGTFGHRGYSVRQIVNHMYFTLNGVFGTPLGVSSTYIFLFILFGSFLEKTGVGRLFIDLANAVAGKHIGGQIMPPIMGAAAFLMAESTGFTYAQVVKSAIIPAVLYFSGILISVHHEARKIGLKGMEDKDIPKIGVVMRERGHLLMPLIFMIYMLSAKVTPTYAALGAILASLMACSIQWLCLIPVAMMVAGMNTGLHFTVYSLAAIGIWLAICVIRGCRIREKLTAREWINAALGFDPYDMIVDALKNGSRSVLAVVVACAMAGMIVGTVTLTGLGLKLATGLAQIAGNNIYLLLFFTMLSSIVLGMGVPTTANYLITSTICAPAIINMVCMMRGVPVTEPTMAIIMSAHLFVFYFGIVADITPPVALAAMAGSAIAKGEPFKTGVNATRLAIGAFIVPYIFVMNPAMLMIDTTVWAVVQNVATALIGMYALSGGLAGFVQDHCKWYERILLIAGGLGMIIPGTVSDLLGFATLAAIFAIQRKRYSLAHKITA